MTVRWLFLIAIGLSFQRARSTSAPTCPSSVTCRRRGAGHCRAADLVADQGFTPEALPIKTRVPCHAGTTLYDDRYSRWRPRQRGRTQWEVDSDQREARAGFPHVLVDRAPYGRRRGACDCGPARPHCRAGDDLVGKVERRAPGEDDTISRSPRSPIRLPSPSSAAGCRTSSEAEILINPSSDYDAGALRCTRAPVMRAPDAPLRPTASRRRPSHRGGGR